MLKSVPTPTNRAKFLDKSLNFREYKHQLLKDNLSELIKMKSAIFIALFLVAMVFAEPEPEADPSLGLGLRSSWGAPGLGLGHGNAWAANPAIGSAWGRGAGLGHGAWGNPGLGLGRSAWAGKAW